MGPPATGPWARPGERLRWDDERGAVGKVIVVTLVLFGLAAVETGSIIFTKLSLENTASAVASDAVTDLISSHNPQAACATALESTHRQDEHARLVSCVADPRKGEVVVKLKKIASTILVKRLGFLRKLGVVRAKVDTGPST